VPRATTRSPHPSPTPHPPPMISPPSRCERQWHYKTTSPVRESLGVTGAARHALFGCGPLMEPSRFLLMWMLYVLSTPLLDLADHGGSAVVKTTSYLGSGSFVALFCRASEHLPDVSVSGFSPGRGLADGSTRLLTYIHTSASSGCMGGVRHSLLRCLALHLPIIITLVTWSVCSFLLGLAIAMNGTAWLASLPGDRPARSRPAVRPAIASSTGRRLATSPAWGGRVGAVLLTGRCSCCHRRHPFTFTGVIVGSCALGRRQSGARGVAQHRRGFGARDSRAASRSGSSGRRLSDLCCCAACPSSRFRIAFYASLLRGVIGGALRGL